MMRRKILLVVGMHRSGTSALAGTLARLGPSVPEHLIPPSSNNPKGYWESAKIRDAHEEALVAAGVSWDSPMPIPEGWFQSAEAARAGKSLRDVVDRELGISDFALVKDPRLCRLLPLWREVFGEEEADLRVVIPVRNPLEVAISLQRRNSMPQSYGLLLWLRYVLEAERASRGMKRVVVSYQGLLTDWRATVDHIAQSLELDLPRTSGEAIAEVEAFLSRDYRHEVLADDEVLNRSDPAGLADVHRAFLAWRDAGEPEGMQAVMDGALMRLDAACAVMGSALADMREQSVARGRVVRNQAVEISEYEARQAALDSQGPGQDDTQNAREREAALRKELEGLPESSRAREAVVDARLDKLKAEEDLTRLRADHEAARAALSHRFQELRMLQQDNRALLARVRKLERVGEELDPEHGEGEETLPGLLGEALTGYRRSLRGLKDLGSVLRDPGASEGGPSTKKKRRRS